MSDVVTLAYAKGAEKIGMDEREAHLQLRLVALRTDHAKLQRAHQKLTKEFAALKAIPKGDVPSMLLQQKNALLCEELRLLQLKQATLSKNHEKLVVQHKELQAKYKALQAEDDRAALAYQEDHTLPTEAKDAVPTIEERRARHAVGWQLERKMRR